MVFSTNQVRQFYVVTESKTRQDFLTECKSANPNFKAGQTALQDYPADSTKTWGSHNNQPVYEFLYVNSSNQLTHSDIIPKENIRKVKFTTADKMKVALPSWEIKNVMPLGTNENEYTDGDVFYVNFEFPGFLNATDEEIETKTVAFEFNSNDGTWAEQMEKAINLAFNSRNNLDNELLSVETSGDDTVVVTAKEGNWILGTYNNKPNQIIISNLTMEDNHTPGLSPLPLVSGGRVKKYGEPKEVTGTNQDKMIPNGKITADLEYFCMGERGDIYRNIGWPNVIRTKYLVDPNKEYDYLDIHFYFQGEGVRDDKSEKLITLVQESGAGILEGFRDTICGTSSSSNSSNGSSTSNEENPEDGNVGTND